MGKRFLSLILIFSSFCSFAQYWEAGVYLGGSNYMGDLDCGLKQINQTLPTYGAIGRYNVNPWITIKGNIYHGAIEGNDANSNSDAHRLRNLSFKSQVLDIGIQPEFNLRGYKSGHPAYKSSPYIFIGISVFRFNPKAEYQGKWYALQPLCTEGEGTTKYNDRQKYSLTQVSIPIGVGWKYALTRNWNIGIELSAHKTFTDYLDDVSTTYVEPDILQASYGTMSRTLSNRTGEVGQLQSYDSSVNRGNSTTKDWYYFGGIFISYSILPNRCYRF